MSDVKVAQLGELHDAPIIKAAFEQEPNIVVLLNDQQAISAGINVSVYKGKDGVSPHVGANQNWWVGDEDTGISAYVSIDDLDQVSKQELEDGYVAKMQGKGLSTNDLTDELKDNIDAAYAYSQAQHAPDDAERNVLVGVRTADGALAVSVDREIEIPIATGALAGLVKGSHLPGSVSINEDATMTINAVNVNKLYVDVDDEFILVGGGART